MHQEQTVDPSWAGQAQRSFQADLASLATTLPFQLQSLDCRTTSCLATLRWESAAAAARNSRRFIRRYGMNCGIDFLMPDRGTDVSASTNGVVTTVIFDCEASRASGGQSDSP